jgi:uncharacterized membrane protein
MVSFHHGLPIFTELNYLSIARHPRFPDDQRVHREGAMKDLKADWRRWTRAERIIAVFVGFGTIAMLPALFLLGHT